MNWLYQCGSVASKTIKHLPLNLALYEKRKNVEYNDDYGTCEETYVTLLVYPGEIPFSEISFILGLTPTRTSKKQDFPRKRVNGWFYSTQKIIQSRDCRRHIDFILDQIIERKDAVRYLKQKGVKIEMTCCWHSASGHGGPTISPYQMKKLVELDIEIWWDIYFSDED
ncbi:DUF4279 domain-containing protein [Zooshikella marina]|uniref:DUF4279 domain-containing protein n=1 Tax=Zooshikella ganghwensis TaxID=202772 RepID=UPI001BAE8D64|nr:DUF4279 domain-containing protein [Zooshikella ganghwensis]MBU2707196.1 DUF4279 domain-containing protein [Zooshikella ganghwensis]